MRATCKSGGGGRVVVRRRRRRRVRAARRRPPRRRRALRPRLRNRAIQLARLFDRAARRIPSSCCACTSRASKALFKVRWCDSLAPRGQFFALLLTDAQRAARRSPANGSRAAITVRAAVAPRGRGGAAQSRGRAARRRVCLLHRRHRGRGRAPRLVPRGRLADARAPARSRERRRRAPGARAPRRRRRRSAAGVAAAARRPRGSSADPPRALMQDIAAKAVGLDGRAAARCGARCGGAPKPTRPRSRRAATSARAACGAG